jgi:alcohol dehydrogenase class IV
LTSVFGGIALANSGLGAVHGLAGVLGGWCGAPHGALCGRLLPSVLRVNAQTIPQNGDTKSEARFRDVANWLTGRPDLDGLIDFLHGLLELGQVPKLKDMGLDVADFETVAEASRTSSSMKGNPVVLSRDALVQVLKEAY